MACSALYRQSKLGLSLVDALDQLVEEGKLPPQLALRILDEVRRPLRGPVAPRFKRASGGAPAIASAATGSRRVGSALPPPGAGRPLCRRRPALPPLPIRFPRPPAV